MAAPLGGSALIAGGEEIAGTVPVTVTTLASLTATTVRDGATVGAAGPRMGLFRGGVIASVTLVAAPAVPRAGVMLATS